MKPLSVHRPEALTQAVSLMRNEGVFAYPTDTIYGLGGSGLSEKVLDRIYTLKKRSEFMPVSLIVADEEMFFRYAKDNPAVRVILREFLPGALTLIVAAGREIFPERIYSEGMFTGLRMPAHDFCLRLSAESGLPLITTSVNVHGEASLNHSRDIIRVFGDQLDAVFMDEELDAASGNLGSTIVKISDDHSLKCIREGQIAYGSIRDSLATVLK